MKKLSDYENESAIELLADIMDPVTNILSDTEIANEYRSNQNKVKLIQLALKNHPKEILGILARIDNTPVDEYRTNVLKMTKDLIELLNDKELVDFFTSQEQLTDGEPSRSVAANIKGKEK